MNTFYYEKYAAVLVKVALNMKKGDCLIIKASPWDYEFVRIVEETAYREGAKHVKCDYEDALERRYRGLYCLKEFLEYIPKWQIEYVCGYVNDGALILDITSPCFGINDGVLPEHQKLIQKSMDIEKNSFNKARKQNGTIWVKAAMPSKKWAKVMYPGISEGEAYEKLWKNIIQIVRLDCEDPVKAWLLHKEELSDKKAFLDSLNIRALHVQGPGTDLKVELVPGSKWTGGYDTSPKLNREYIPNIPTEELFAVPHKYRVNGDVSSTLPLNYNGTLIEGIKLKIEKGKVLEATAEAGNEVLQNIINTDEGASYFGEISLVSVNSPIYQSGQVFYTTLLDENAVCHMAFGKALTGGVDGANDLSEDQQDVLGLNFSNIHVDFMIGSSQIKVVAINQMNQELILMENGEWCI